jgi:hypothetical protein
MKSIPGVVLSIVALSAAGCSPDDGSLADMAEATEQGLGATTWVDSMPTDIDAVDADGRPSSGDRATQLSRLTPSVGLQVKRTW